MKNLGKILLFLVAFAALASCGAHEKCPTYNGQLETEQPTNV